MKIGIDARLWNETGVGRYIRALVTNLASTGNSHEFTLFLRRHEYNELPLPGPAFRKVLADVPWHTVTEQLKMPAIYSQAKVDLIHIPYFAVPVFTPLPFVVTIHDLTISHFSTGKATTLAYPIYRLKHFGYKIVLSYAVKRAATIITVSETVKKQLTQEYSIDPGKVVVTYEAGDLENGIKSSRGFPDQYLLYVGNAHPHKNIEKLIEAYEMLRTQFPKLKLILIGKHDYFYARIKSLISVKKLTSDIILPGNVSNAELVSWYSHAAVFVIPSLAEGFGIPALEAMSLECPVVCSNIGVFHEIYGEAAVYFNLNNKEDLVAKLIQVLNNKTLRNELVRKGKNKAHEYSWSKMTRETLSIYENCIRI
ncbi:MAG: glycosyltransferase family 1 protein [Patescibacteria group bacterium]